MGQQVFPSNVRYELHYWFLREGVVYAMSRSWPSREESGRTTQAGIHLLSVLSRVVPASYFTIVCYGFWMNFTQTGKWTSLLWMASEGLVVLLLVFRRTSHRISRNPWDWVIGIAGSLTVLLVRPAETSLVPIALGSALQIGGTVFSIYGKAMLGRSFGIVAANRGIVVEGAYRVVRHPIYLGYLVTHIGFLLANWSSRNVALYIIEYCFQVYRILAEERLLKEDELYRAYTGRVRYRLIPRIF